MSEAGRDRPLTDQQLGRMTMTDPRITSAQKKQIERMMADALGNINPTKASAQRMIERGDELVGRLGQMLMELGVDDGETSSQRAVRKIMGKNFLGIPEVVEHFGAISPADLIALQTIPFDEETLKACAETHILVADVGLSLLNVRQKARKGLFCPQDWFDNEEFAKRTETARWRLIRKIPVEGLFSKNWGEQQALIDDSISEVPSARQVVYTMILHFLATGERLFEKVYVRTSDVDSDGSPVDVGGFDGAGLGVVAWYVSGHLDDLGLASARKS